MEGRDYMRLSELLLHCCDGSAGREEMEELEAILKGNPRAQEYYVEFLMDLNYFHGLAQTPLSPSAVSKGVEADFMSELDPQQQLALLGDFAEYEKHAAAVEVAPSPLTAERPPLKRVDYERPVRRVNKFSLAAAVLSTAAFLLMLCYVHLAPPAPYEVATVVDAMNADWSSPLPIHAGTRLTSDLRPIQLTRGIVRIRTDDQVEVVLEAPAEFCFQSYSEVAMSYGKLFAHVSQQGHGFSVVTPNTKVVDLGTEFGVLSHIDGNTEVHLYKGRANLFAGGKHQPKISQLLSAGAARRVEGRTSAIREIALNEQALVRHIDSGVNLVWRGQDALRLTDLLLGGNGFGTAARRTLEFEPETGRAVAGGETGYRPGPGRLIPIPDSPYLDGLFVPGARAADTVISSAGHLFRGGPETTGLYYANIGCLKEWSFFDPLQGTFEQSRKAYPDAGVLYLHSNIGVTVDLEAVRRQVPGLTLSSFRTFAGIIRMGANPPEFAEVDVRVLVDGEIRSARKGLRAEEGFDIRVELNDQDRFLSLVVTDGGNAYVDGWPANHLDTCGFAEPVFGLESK